MTNAILVPGRPDKDKHYDPTLPSNNQNYWFAWLQRQLIIRDVHTVSIEPPFPFRPRYDEWQKEFERFDITPETILIGHSCGGGFLIRWLSENKVKVGKVVLVAPWINPHNVKESDTADFFDFDIDPNFPSRSESVTVFVSQDDFSGVRKTVEILKDSAVGINVIEYANKGYFTMAEFPELLDQLLKAR